LPSLGVARCHKEITGGADMMMFRVDLTHQDLDVVKHLTVVVPRRRLSRPTEVPPQLAFEA